jgi:N-acetylglutamate synthase-like GNAT family acetyltransferase
MKLIRFNKKERDLIQSDLPSLKAMCDYIPVMNSWMLEQLEKSTFFVYAMEETKILGFMILDHRDTHLELELICVGSQKGGIGRALMMEAERIAGELSLKEIHLNAQLRAEGFYSKLDYKDVKRYDNGIRMKKIL